MLKAKSREMRTDKCPPNVAAWKSSVLYSKSYFGKTGWVGKYFIKNWLIIYFFPGSVLGTRYIVVPSR